MLIKALYDYYDVLEKHGLVLSPEFSSVPIHYVISLTPEGKIDSIINYQIKDGVDKKAKEQPRKLSFPKRTEKTAIDSNFIEHRPMYIFGLGYDKNNKCLTCKLEKAKKSHTAFVDKHLEIIEGINTPLVNAFRNYITNWNPENELQNEELVKLGAKIETYSFTFCLMGRVDTLLNDCPELLKKWIQMLNTEEKDGVAEQCAVTGEILPIARIHDKIKGIPGGQSSGTTLISFNSASEESYCKTQSFNSNISQPVMEHYTVAMNYLISHKEHRTFMDEVTILHWAASGNDEYDELFNELLFGEETIDENETNELLKKIMEQVKEGTLKEDIDLASGMIDKNVDFYIVGIKPNASRLSIKFVYRNKFGTVIRNVAQHIADMRICEYETPTPLWRIGKELVSPKSSNDKVNPALLAQIMDAIINNNAYPTSLLSILINRVKTDSDTEKNSFVKMNDIRMGMIRACINRSARQQNKKEEISLALDKGNRNPAYLCGRLFAVLEGIQQKASGYNLNRTIKDAYFSTAASNPSVIFSKLLSLSQHHMAKLDNPYYAEREIMEIMDALGGEFPTILSLTEQGIFMLGYYQQKSYSINQAKQNKEDK